MASGDEAPCHGGPDSKGHFESLVYSLELESQECLKMIMEEEIHLQFLEDQHHEMNTEISQLQPLTLEVDFSTKGNEIQLFRDNNIIERYTKKNAEILAQVDTLQKEIESFKLQQEVQRNQFQETLLLYKNVWHECLDKYTSHPLAKELMCMENKLAEVEVDHFFLQQRKERLESNVQEAKDLLQFQDWKKFCVKIAEKNVNLVKQFSELDTILQEKTELQAEENDLGEESDKMMAEKDEIKDNDQSVERDSDDTEQEEPEVQREDTTTNLTTGEGISIEEATQQDKSTDVNETEERDGGRSEERVVPLILTCTIKSETPNQVSSVGYSTAECLLAGKHDLGEPEYVEDESSALVPDTMPKSCVCEELPSQEMPSTSQNSDFVESHTEFKQPLDSTKEKYNIGNCDEDTIQQQEMDCSSSLKPFKGTFSLLTGASRNPAVRSAMSTILAGNYPPTLNSPDSPQKEIIPAKHPLLYMAAHSQAEQCSSHPIDDQEDTAVLSTNGVEEADINVKAEVDPSVAMPPPKKSAPRRRGLSRRTSFPVPGLVGTAASSTVSQLPHSWKPGSKRKAGAISPPVARNLLAASNLPACDNLPSTSNLRPPFGDMPPAAKIAPPVSDMSPLAYNQSQPASDVSPPASDVSPPASDVSQPASEMSPPTYNLPAPGYNLSPLANNQLPPASDMSPQECDMLPPACDMSPPTYNLSPLAYNLSPPASEMSPPTYNLPVPGYNLSPLASDQLPPARDMSPQVCDMLPPACDMSPPTYNLSPPATDMPEPEYILSPSARNLLLTASAMSEPDYILSSPTSNLLPAASAMSEPEYILSSPTSNLLPPASDMSEPEYILSPTASDLLSTASDMSEPEYILSPSASDLLPTASAMSEPEYILSSPTSNLLPPASAMSEPEYVLSQSASNLLPPASDMSEPEYILSQPASNLSQPVSDMSPPRYNPSQLESNQSSPASNHLPPASHQSPLEYNLSQPANNLSPEVFNLLAYNLLPPASDMSPPASDLSSPPSEVSSTASDMSPLAYALSPSAGNQSPGVNHSSAAADNSASFSLLGRPVSTNSSTLLSAPCVTVTDAGDSPSGPKVNEYLEPGKCSPTTGERGDSQDEDMDTDAEEKDTQTECTPSCSSEGFCGFSSTYSPSEMEKRLKELKESPFYMTSTKRVLFPCDQPKEDPPASAEESSDKTAKESPLFKFGFSSPPEEPAEQFRPAPLSSDTPMPDQNKSTSNGSSEEDGLFFNFQPVSMDATESSGTSLLSLFGKSSEVEDSAFSFNFDQNESSSGNDPGFQFNLGESIGDGHENESGPVFNLF